MSKQVYLGYVLLVLPFINREWNVLCHNPEETDINKIELISIEEFCEIIGYTSTQSSRLVAEYKKIELPALSIGSIKQPFIGYITIPATKVKGVFINPNIIYKGKDRDKVAFIGGASNWGKNNKSCPPVLNEKIVFSFDTQGNP